MSTRALNLSNILFQGGRCVLVEDVVPEDSTSSDAFSGFAGAGVLLFRCEARKLTAAAPALTITVEHSADGDSWATLDAFAAISAEGEFYLLVTTATLDRIRFSYAVTDAGLLKLELRVGLAHPVGLPDAADADAGDLLTADGAGGFAWLPPA